MKLHLIFFALFVFLTSCHPNGGARTDFYGEYIIVDTKMGMGGVVPDDIFEKMIGRKVLIGRNDFDFDNIIKTNTPIYIKKIIPIPKIEGVVGDSRYSYFYDIDPERDRVELIEVSSQKSPDEALAEFEILPDGITINYGGRFVICKRVGGPPEESGQ
jgi:hypothetical protein